MIRGTVLLLALLVNAPTVWAALWTQTVSVDSAMIHYLLTVPIVGLLVGLFRLATTSAPSRAPEKQPSPDA